MEILDIAKELPLAPSESRTPRRGSPSSITVHYNGPPLPFVPDPKRELDFIKTVDVKNHQERLGADSLQYHFAVLSNGLVYRTREENLIAWHAGNVAANAASLAVHLPLGDKQNIFPEQKEALYRLISFLAAKYKFPQNAVYGHCEWPRTVGLPQPSRTYKVCAGQSRCPGPLIHKAIVEYRERFYTYWRVRWRSPVRPVPATTTRVLYELQPGTVILVQEVVAGEEVRGNNLWLRLSEGYTWSGNAERIKNGESV